MIGRDGRLERREHVNLPLPADLENGAAAVADVQIVFADRTRFRWRRPCLPRTPRRIARGDTWYTMPSWRLETYSTPSGSNASPVAFIRSCDQRLGMIAGIDLVNRHRRLLPGRSAERGVDVPVAVDRRIGHRVQPVGDLDADVAGPGRWPARPLPIINSPAEAPSGTRTITSESEPITTGAASSPKRAVGRSGAGQALAADLELAAGDGRRRGNV